MKIILITFLVSLSMLIYSQTDQSYYNVDQIEIDHYLDTICKKHIKTLYTYQELDLSTSITTGQEWYCSILGDSVKLYSSPTKKSNTIKFFKFGDSVLIPRYKGRMQYSPLYFSTSSGSYVDYIFCVTKEGQYGFIHSNEFYFNSNIQEIPGTDFLLIKHPKKALLKKDYSKSKIFNSYYIDYSDKNKCFVYSVDDHSSNSYSKIYIFNLNNWTDFQIGQGFGPTFFEDFVVYWIENNKEHGFQQLQVYNMKADTDRILFQVPDTLTFWGCGGDICEPRKIEIKRIKNEFQLNFSLCDIKGDDECSKKTEFNILTDFTNDIKQ